MKIPYRRIFASIFAFSLGSGSAGAGVTLLTDLTAPGEFLGSSVAISNGVAVIGTDAAPGGAFIFEPSGGGWVRNPFHGLEGLGGAINQKNYGRAVGISGDHVIVGGGTEATLGSAFLFEKQGATWFKKAQIAPADQLANDNFAWRTAISGDRFIAGSLLDDDFGANAGGAYIYDYDGSDWNLTTKLVPTGLLPNDKFGDYVDIEGNRAIVSTRRENAFGQSVNSSAYVFGEVNGVWSQLAKLTPLDPQVGDNFGHSVAIYGDIALVGAYGHELNGIEHGAVYVFEDTGSGWQQTAKLEPDANVFNSRFGFSVALDGNRALIGARSYVTDYGITGAAFLYEYSGGNWTEVAQLVAPQTETGDQFGESVALDGNLAIVGAPQYTSTGGAFIFAIPEASPVTLLAAALAPAILWHRIRRRSA